MLEHTFVAMHWSFKYDSLVAMRTVSGPLFGMEVGNQSSHDAAEFEKVVTGIIPHYSYCGLPKNNAATFVTGNFWYAALNCEDKTGSNSQSYQLTFIEMPSKNPKVIGETIFAPMYAHAMHCFICSAPCAATTCLLSHSGTHLLDLLPRETLSVRRLASLSALSKTRVICVYMT
jgi:hypothetical protein